MAIEITDAVLLDARHEFTFAELVEYSGCTEPELRELMEYGALVPAHPEEAQWTFRGEFVVSVRAAVRLREDLELDAPAVALALKLISRIHELEGQLREAQAQLPQRHA
jgi:chaperone modulatory protein CbpM